MKKFKFMISVILLSLLFVSYSYAQTKIPKKNIEKFHLSVFTSTIDNSDSLRISIFMEIPYNALQYVKRDSQFVAQYEASVAVQNKKGLQLGREVWQDSIIVSNYNYTRSNSKNHTLMASYKIPSGKYKIMGTLLDIDTKKIGKNSLDLDMSEYKNNRFLHKPILLEKFKGNWGFGENLIPAINNRSSDIENGLSFYLSGKVTKGKYNINIQYNDKNGDELFNQTIEDTSENGIFKHLVNLPSDKIKGITIEIKAELIQKSDNIEKMTKVVLRKEGISQLVDDIDIALEQMRYILTSKEIKRVKKTSILKSEELFRDLWEIRDPTPGTTVNELMNEYYRRVNFSNIHFGGFMDGWETDMGMIYIILGPPDDIEKYIDDQYQEPYEVWHYYRIQEDYIFVGDNFGNYKLLTPFFGYRR